MKQQVKKQNLLQKVHYLPLSSDFYFLEPAEYIVSNANVTRNPISTLHADCSINDLTSVTSADEECIRKTKGNDLRGYINNQQKVLVVDRSRCAFAKLEHAFAGAFAGIFVSLCLHPVDTIKTVIQSCHNQNSLHYISRSIISERGMFPCEKNWRFSWLKSQKLCFLYPVNCMLCINGLCKTWYGC